jgi:hypothetical protein
MKKLHWITLFVLLSLPLTGQRNSDFGLLGGVSSYIGDINPGKLMYSPLPAGGLFYRYNLHPRQSIRTSILVGGLRANDLDFGNSFQQARAASFSGVIGEWSAQFEFNFLPYTTRGKRWNYTPYIAGGVGVAFINTTVFTYTPVIPFSLGFKINFYKNFGLEAEYGFRKTFYDNFDGLKDLTAPSDYSWLHNNDWYSFAGLAFTWKFFNRLIGCPAYEDVDKRRKR